MILVDAGQRDARSFDSRLLFATALQRAGFAAGLDEQTLPETLHRNHKYEAQSLVCAPNDVDVRGVIVIGAERVTDAALTSLRAYALGPEKPIVAIGRFLSFQARIGTESKIAYASGVDPIVLDLDELLRSPFVGQSIAPIAIGAHPSNVWGNPVRILVFVPEELVEDDRVRSALAVLNSSVKFSVVVITSASGKSLLRQNGLSAQTILAYAELSPFTLAEMSDLAIVLGAGLPGERAGQACTDLLGAGGVVVDSTQSGQLFDGRAPIVRGPVEPSALPNFVEYEILPRIEAIRKEIAASDWCRKNRLSVLTDRFPEDWHPDSRLAPEKVRSKTVFVPTNGVGLGHAQRCTQIAARMDADQTIAFAAFPSCTELTSRRGYETVPLVAKSPAHGDPYANDIINYRRLSRMLNGGDRLVFDGVYVFDSIYRVIMEKHLDAVWIRRGLWRSHQTNEVALEREHCFGSVIVPTEAFDELNEYYSFGPRINHVGPIVQHGQVSASGIRATRKAIAERFGRDFDRLVVSMLGGGVAADRGPQLQMLAAALEPRRDCLHLVVVWPNATVASGLTCWSNTLVVRSLDALSLCQAADFVVSAVGYNSFHEILYHAIPAIFVPQVASYMDDQERRARAAADRGLAEIVLADELLLLERRLGAFLENGRADELRSRLRETSLPEPGNTAAAQAIAREHTHDARRLA